MHRLLQSFVFLFGMQLSSGRGSPDIEAELVHRMALLGPFPWMTVAVLLDGSDADSDWISDLRIPRLVVDLHGGQLPALAAVDAYVIISHDFASVVSAVTGALNRKRLDPLKPFIVFLGRSDTIWVSQVDPGVHRLDVILVEKASRRNAQDGSRRPILNFRRHRQVSKLTGLFRMSGVFDGSQLDAKGLQILQDRTFSLHDRTLKVSAFVIPPTTVVCNNGAERQLCGRDVNLVRAIGQKLHFRPEFVEPPNKQKWGFRLPNGTWTGLFIRLNAFSAIYLPN